jgi:hypothetical protein
MSRPSRGPGVALGALLAGLAAAAPPAAEEVDDGVARRLAGLALDCIEREYPNKISHVLNGDEDVAPPRDLTPAFRGCFDWHSAVHGHWLLVRLARAYPEADFAAPALAAVGRNITPESIVAEVEYLSGEGRAGFERPYGLAWLLQLGAELREWDAPAAAALSATLEPLERAAVGRLADWIPKLTYPIRVGEHSQTAFAFGLILDWARGAGDEETEALLVRRGQELYGADRDCPLAYEPSGHDFLSPCIAEADFMRRVLAPEEFPDWLSAFLPGIPTASEAAAAGAAWLPVAVVSDRTDGKLAHLDGLNLSRAWMLEGILSALPQDDSRRFVLADAAREHREAGLASVTGEHYAGGHWLGSFATYLVTGRGYDGSP